MSSLENIRKQFRLIWLQDKLIAIFLALALFFNLALWVILISMIRPTTDSIVLHYNIYFGINLVGEWWKIYFIPGVSFLIFIVNLYLGLRLYQKRSLLTYFLSFFSLFIQVLILVGIINLIFINL